MKNTKDLLTTNKKIRLIGILEGISYLILLGIAMPLKYYGDKPEAVKYVGWIHGLLFIFFVIAIAMGYFFLNWKLKKSVAAFIASLLPFGTFVFDRQLRKDELDLIKSN